MRAPSNNPLSNFVRKQGEKAVQEMAKRAPSMAQVKESAVKGALQATAKVMQAKQQIAQGANQVKAKVAEVKQQAVKAATAQVAKLPDVKKAAIKSATETMAKHGPKMIETANSFKNGARGGDPMKGTTNRIAHEAGGLARDLAADKPKKEFEKKGKAAIGQAAIAVQNKVANPANPAQKTLNQGAIRSANQVLKPGMLTKPMVGGGIKTNKPMSVPKVGAKPAMKPNFSGLGKSSIDPSKE